MPKRLDESLEKLEQGDLQLQIRVGESDRQLRRMINAQQSMGQSILLGCLGISAALLGSTSRSFLSIIQRHKSPFPSLISSRDGCLLWRISF